MKQFSIIIYFYINLYVASFSGEHKFQILLHIYLYNFLSRNYILKSITKRKLQSYDVRRYNVKFRGHLFFKLKILIRKPLDIVSMYLQVTHKNKKLINILRVVLYCK